MASSKRSKTYVREIICVTESRADVHEYEET
jgi:hypothetical protein